MATTVLKITHSKAGSELGGGRRLSSYPAGEARTACAALASLLESIAAGQEKGVTVELGVGGTTAVRASGTATAGTADGNITINGVNIAYTGASANARAADIAAKINASVDPLVSKIVTASYPGTGAVATITAYAAGKMGNSVTLAITGTGASVSGARLTGGAGDDVSTTSYARG